MNGIMEMLKSAFEVMALCENSIEIYVHHRHCFILFSLFLLSYCNQLEWWRASRIREDNPNTRNKLKNKYFSISFIKFHFTRNSRIFNAFHFVLRTSPHAVSQGSSRRSNIEYLK